MTTPTSETPPAFTGRFTTSNHYRIPPWEPRIDRISALMTSANAHVFGTQETEEIAEKGILERIQPAGTFKVFSDRSNITLIGRSDLFEALWHGEYSVPADNRSRHHQAAKLRHRETGVELLVMNAHFSNGSAWAAVRTSHAKAIVALLGKLTLDGTITDQTPVILAGDFNDKRRANETGPAQIFKAAGLIDPRDVIGYPNVIDRVYTRNCIMRAWSKITTPNTVSDHDWYTLTVDVGLGAPKPPPPLVKTKLQELEAEHGKVTEFKISSFEAARVSGFPSRYSAIVQDWLGREVTTQWTTADQLALDEWRHLTFPSWPPRDYTGSVGLTSMTRLRDVAKAAGKTTYQVVK